MRSLGCCGVAVTFLLGQVVISLNPRIKKESKEYLATLGKEQLLMYQLVVNERMRIYKRATLAGVVAGVLAMLACPKNMSALARACAFLSAGFVVQYFWYILSPKEYSMVPVLDTKKQREEWQDVYREYQWSWHIGLVVGLVGYFLLGLGW